MSAGQIVGARDSEAALASQSLALLRITRLAAALPIHRAFHWLHLHQPRMRQWQLQFLAVPAPTFGEHDRAVWFADRFRELGLDNVHLDPAGNVLGELPAYGQDIDPTQARVLLISAHLDTVFPAGTDTTPREDGPRILGPGACDNGAGLAALLGLIAALRFAEIAPPMTLLFAANTGEEGEGDLRGMRELFERSPYANRIAAALALEGAGTGAAVTRALGSRRFRVTLTGPGGHSWSDAGAPNPILLISQALSQFAALPSLTRLSDAPRTTLSPGLISGGTSINSIPASAQVSLDLRSTSAAELETHTALIERTFHALASENVTVQIDSIGNRPAAELPANSPLLHTLRAVDRHLNLHTDLRLGSTDANLPLSLGIPAAALAAGGTCAGIHTLAEWYDPTGRELALRRILLSLLDLAQTL